MWGNTESAVKLLGKITTSAEKDLFCIFFFSHFSWIWKKVILNIILCLKEIHDTTHELHFINAVLDFLIIFYAFVHACILEYYEINSMHVQ